MNVNLKGFGVAECKATKFMLNPQMFSTLKNTKTNLSMNPGGRVETSMVVPMVILVALVKIKIGKVITIQGVVLVDPP